jgi:SAM-dependent methyltransferase
MAEQVPDGSVTATDIKDTGSPPHPRLNVLRHDIVSDPIEPGYDLIYARAVLTYLADPRKVVQKLARALAPGGTLLIEEYDLGWRRLVDAPDLPTAMAIFDGHQLIFDQLMRATGGNPEWCWSVPRLMREAGLNSVFAEIGGTRTWRGGELGCRLMEHTTARLRARIEASGTDATRRLLVDQLLEYEALLANPRVEVACYLRVATAGSRSAE